VRFVGKECGFPRLLPSQCKLIWIFLSEGCREFGLASTLVLTVAKKVHNEANNLFAELMIIVSTLKLTENIQQLRSRKPIVVYVFTILYFLAKSFEELMEGFERMVAFLSLLEPRSLLTRAMESI
jgi:hypothetical protein